MHGEGLDGEVDIEGAHSPGTGPVREGYTIPLVEPVSDSEIREKDTARKVGTPLRDEGALTLELFAPLPPSPPKPPTTRPAERAIKRPRLRPEPLTQEPSSSESGESEDSSSSDECTEDEVSAYTDFKSPREENFDVLSWWKEHATRFPNVAHIARSILSIPASSAASERDFSTAGFVVSERRSQLKPATVDDILFLHSNLKKH